MKIVVIDCETGGLDAKKHSLLEVAGVLWDTQTGETRLLFDFMVDEGKNNVTGGRSEHRAVVADPGALEVNGIDLADVVANGLSPLDACKMINEALIRELGRDDDALGRVLDRVTMAAQNAAFDAAFLRRIYEFSGVSWPFSHRMLDTSSVLRWLMVVGAVEEDEPKTTRLWELTDTPQPADRHRARGDAMQTAEALAKLASWNKELLAV